MTESLDAAVFALAFAPVPAANFIDLLQRTGFSAEAYRDAFDDLVGLNWSAQQALSHFIYHGLDERRAVPLTLDRQALAALARLPMRDGGFKAKLLNALAARLFDQVSHPYGAAIAERWPAVRALAHEGARPYFVAGDSHSHQFALAGARSDSWLLPIHLLCTGGSAGGLGNSASISGYGRLLRQAVATIEQLPDVNDIPFLLQFGQVDIEFVYHFRRVKDGQRKLRLNDYRAYCDATLERYIRFVADLFGSPGRLRICLVSVFPPALSDAAWYQGYVNADIAQRETSVAVDDLRSGIRTLEIADLRQRTEVHAYYCDRLRAECRRLGFGFIDSFTPFLGPDGTVDPRYVNPDAGGAEHHLDYRQTYDIIQDVIWRYIAAAGESRVLFGDP